MGASQDEPAQVGAKYQAEGMVHVAEPEECLQRFNAAR